MKCVECGAQLPAADGDVLQLTEADFERVLSLAAFGAPCPACGVQTPVGRPALYVDSKDRFAVRLSPDGADPCADEPDIPDDYIQRDVPDLMRFREKVMLLSGRMDDRAVELVKYQTELANSAANLTDILVLQIIDDGLVLNACLPSGEDLTFGSPMELYEKIRAQIPAHGAECTGMTRVDRDWVTAHFRPADAPES